MLATTFSRIAAVLTAVAQTFVGCLQRNARMPGVRVVLQHWLRERRTLQQGFIALSIGVGITLLAGVVLGAMDRLLAELPGLLMLAPAAIGMRGAIFGALGARMGTGMLTGQLDASYARTSFLGQNVQAATVLSAITAVVLAAIAKGVAAMLGLQVIAFTDLVVVSMVGTILSSAVVLLVVVVLVRTAQRQSWDMDAIGTPIISATADITTLPALAAATLAIGNATVSGVLGWASVVGAAVIAVVDLRSRGDLGRRVVRESLPVLMYAAGMGVMAGTVLEARKESLISNAALLVAVPPFIASSGAIGGILSARLSSHLHLGLIHPRALPDRPVWLEASMTLLLSLLAYLSVGLLTFAASAALGYDSPPLATLVGITVTAGLLAVVIIVAVAYYAATASFHFGLDPDNVGIPLVTSSMDFAGILCLVVAIALFGAG